MPLETQFQPITNFASLAHFIRGSSLSVCEKNFRHLSVIELSLTSDSPTSTSSTPGTMLRVLVSYSSYRVYFLSFWVQNVQAASACISFLTQWERKVSGIQDRAMSLLCSSGYMSHSSPRDYSVAPMAPSDVPIRARKGVCTATRDLSFIEYSYLYKRRAIENRI